MDICNFLCSKKSSYSTTISFCFVFFTDVLVIDRYIYIEMDLQRLFLLSVTDVSPIFRHTSIRIWYGDLPLQTEVSATKKYKLFSIFAFYSNLLKHVQMKLTHWFLWVFQNIIQFYVSSFGKKMLQVNHRISLKVSNKDTKTTSSKSLRFFLTHLQQCSPLFHWSTEYWKSLR